MAIIYSYPAATPIGSDTMIGTQQAVDESGDNLTVTFTVASIANFTKESIFPTPGTVGYLPVFSGGRTLADSPIFVDSLSSPTLTTVGTNLTITGGSSGNNNLTVGGETQTNSLLVDNTLNVEGTATFTGDVVCLDIIDMGSNQIMNLADPTAAQDAATKAYVDAGDLESEFAITLRQPARFQVAVQPGDPVYITGYNVGQNRYEVDLAQAGDPARMPAIGVAADTYGANDNGYIITHGAATGINTNAFNVGDTVWVAQGGGLTNTRPSGTNLVQNVGVVGKKSGGAGEIEAIALGRTNDVPNIPRGSMWVGDATGVANPLPIGTAGQVLVSDGADVNWEDPEVQGSGTTNTVPLWSDGPNGVLADSILSQDTNPTDTGLVDPGNRVKTDGTLGVKDSLIVNYTDNTYPRVFPPYNPTSDFNTEPTGRIGVVNDVNTLEWAFSAVSIGGLAPTDYSNRSGLLHGSGNGYRLLLSNATEQTIFLNSNGNSFIQGGNLAIGHDTPTQKLDVLGDIKATNVRTERVRPQQGGTVVKINQANFFDTGNISNVSNTDIGATLHLRTQEPLTDQDVIALTKGGQGTGFASGIKQSAQGEYTLLLRDNLNSKSIKLSSNKNATSFIDNALIYLGGNTNNQNGAITISNRSWANGVRNALIQFNKSGTQSDTALEFKQGVSALRGSITYSATGTSYNVTSDYRVKENVVAITDGIERLKQLKPSKFNFITDAEKVVDGFIAHEVQDVIPEAVTGEKDATEEYEVTPAEYDDYGNLVAEAVMGTRDAYQQIDQAKIVPLLTAALQEAVSKIEALEARIQTLENI